jgi:hypothetical protein
MASEEPTRTRFTRPKKTVTNSYGQQLMMAAQYFVLGLLITYVAFPVYWTVQSSFKIGNSLFGNPTLFPLDPTGKNYVDLFGTEFMTYFQNSVIVGIGAIVLTTTLATLGGYVEQAAIEEGDYQVTIYLAPSVDVRQVIDAVEAAYPAAEMLRRQQISRDRDDPKLFQRHLVKDLTDRQQTALETAYHAGFFEWPRDTSGEEVAESIGVAPPTFHQHLRKAERKVFDAVFSSPMQSVG